MSAARKMRRRGVVVRASVLEGYRLGHRLMLAARENQANDPLEYLDFLRRMRRGYDPAHDGPSQLMRLVDDIQDFERRQADKRKAGSA